MGKADKSIATLFDCSRKAAGLGERSKATFFERERDETAKFASTEFITIHSRLLPKPRPIVPQTVGGFGKSSAAAEIGYV
jgi:hypothetical protein